MQFIELTGKVLQRIISDDELHPDELAALGVTDEVSSASTVRATSNSAAPTVGT